MRLKLPLNVCVWVSCFGCCSFAATTVADHDLRITRAPGSTSISWDAVYTGVSVLEYSSDLSLGWLAVSTNNGSGFFEHATGNAGSGFYRLKWSPELVPPMVLVSGGVLPNSSALSGEKVAPFLISVTEITQDVWQSVSSWASSNGYSFQSSPIFDGIANPVRGVSWNDAIKWCNAKSERESLEPAFQLDGQTFREGNPAREDFARVSMNANASGYRLPTEIEWEWAARGGSQSLGYVYSGSNDADFIAWYRDNSGGKTQPVGTKNPNELGVYDMSGNVDEWLWDFGYDSWRAFRGGSFRSGAASCSVADRGDYDSPTQTIVPSVGMRLVRIAGAPISIDSALNYGPVEIGDMKTLFLTIKNNSPESLTITRIAVPANYSGSWTGTLSAGETQQIPITFEPLETGVYPGLLSIQWTASGGGASVVLSGTGTGAPSGMVYVAGGTLTPSSPIAGRTVSNAFVGKYEVTVADWQRVHAWAISNGYTFDGLVAHLQKITNAASTNLPAYGVMQNNAVSWCNAKSEMENLQPVYRDVGGPFRGRGYGSGVTNNTNANGYRLPTEAEWEWAASGGVRDEPSVYSGVGGINELGWYYSNTTFGTSSKAVGTKKSNELGLHDMSGNISEITFSRIDSLNYYYVVRGGGYTSDAARCRITNRVSSDTVYYTHQGFRLWRNAAQ